MVMTKKGYRIYGMSYSTKLKPDNTENKLDIGEIIEKLSLNYFWCLVCMAAYSRAVSASTYKCKMIK